MRPNFWGSVPIYQPSATRIRTKNTISNAAVPIHLYVMNGVDLSRYDWYICHARFRQLDSP